MARMNMAFFLIVIFLASATTILCGQTRKYEAKVHFAETKSGEFLRVDIEGNQEIHRLRLKPLDNIWDDTTTIFTVDSDEDGNTIVKEVPISQEYTVYQDADYGAVLGIDGSNVNGIISDSLTIRSVDDIHYVYQRGDEHNDYENDYLIPPYDANYEAKDRGLQTEKQSGPYIVEVMIVVDSVLASNFNFNITAIANYLNIFWNAVKARYATIISPKFLVKPVAGLIILSRNSEPFMTNNLYNGDNNRVKGSALFSFGSWMQALFSNLPRYDLAYLQTGRNMVGDDGNSGLAGLAFYATACPNPLLANAMGEDVSAHFIGERAATHEVAHILGAPHDGDQNAGSGSCPWTDGYIMSYIGGKINSLFFSFCSISKMVGYARSSRGSCLSVINNQKPSQLLSLTNLLPGQVQSLDETCQAIFGATATGFNRTTCVQLTCKAPAGNGYYYVYYISIPPPEGVECKLQNGTIGECHDGVCKF